MSVPAAMMQPVPEAAGVGSAFAALPQLVGTAQGQMGAAQGLISNFMQMLPMMERYYQWSHLSPYQQGTLGYRNAMLQDYYIPRIGQEGLANQIRAGMLGLDTSKYGTQLQQYGFLDQKAIDQLNMLGYHYLNPFGNLQGQQSGMAPGGIPGMIAPKVPTFTLNLPNGKSYNLAPGMGSGASGMPSSGSGSGTGSSGGGGSLGW